MKLFTQHTYCILRYCRHVQTVRQPLHLKMLRYPACAFATYNTSQQCYK